MILISHYKPAVLNRSFWRSRNLFSKRFLAAGGIDSPTKKKIIALKKIIAKIFKL
jgi:hypothetical protein